MCGNLALLEPAITPLQRGGFPTFAATLNSFKDIIHSTEKEGTTSVNSNYKSSHVASNFMVICMIMLVRRVCMKSCTVDESLLYTSRKYSPYKFLLKYIFAVEIGLFVAAL